ncbi:MAG: DNA topoisomerase I, partial [Lewinella sp.]|nr:DNA topoisomerase I [Lewinella sp.]
ETIENAERPSRERKLGIDPESGKTVLTRMSRRGPVIQIGAPEELEEGEKPQYANLQPGQSLDTITFEEAIKLFELPKTLGEFQSKEVSVGAGRYGPYIKHDDKYISIPRGEDPLEITLERAKELIREKQKADAPVMTYKGEPVYQGKGRFGPFLKYREVFVNIPRKYDPDNLSPEDAFELIEAKLKKEANRYIHKWDNEGISVENGRWGPFIRFKKKNIKIPKIDGEKVTSETAADLTLEQVKEFIEAEVPDAFKSKKK